MEPSGGMPSMPSSKNESGWKPRPGQQAYRDFIDANPEQWAYPARMPTGYGKTEAILLGYAVLRAKGRANRLLIVVPSTTQETAYCDELQKKATKISVPLTLVIPASATARTLKYHRRNSAEVFVTTIQRLQSAIVGRNAAGNWVAELLSTGQWIGAADEYHHYADNNLWGATFKALPQVCRWLALSATPDRKVGETVFGTPVVNVSYAQALDEPLTVKPVSIKVREYGVDMELVDIGQVRRTTSELREQVGTEHIDEWEARKQLRYLTKYCSPILVHAIGELEHKRLMAPRGVQAQPQMLVYAFSCSHAKSLSVLLRNHAPGFAIDWVGTGPFGRTDDDNKRLTDAFLKGDLDILVQVNMASEGFNSIPVCVIVDLSLTGFGPQKLQAYGRGTRYFYGLGLTIFVPTDSNVAPLAPLMAGIFDLPIDTESPGAACDCCPACPRCEHHIEETRPLPRLEVLDALLIGGMDYEPSVDTVNGVAPAFSRYVGRTLDPTTSEADREMIKAALIEYHRHVQVEQSESMKLAEWPGRIARLVGQVARNVGLVRDGYVETSSLGDYCRALNSRWRMSHDGHDAMTVADFEAKFRWLDDINEEIRLKRIPAWLA